MRTIIKINVFVLIIASVTIGSNEKIFAQAENVLKGDPAHPGECATLWETPYDLGSGNTGFNIGIGIEDATSKLHVKYNGPLQHNRGVFRVEALDVSINLLGSFNGAGLGIYQQGPGLSNIFDGYVGIGKLPAYKLDVKGSIGCSEKLAFSSLSPAIGVERIDDVFQFEFVPTALSGPTIPLKIRSIGIEVNGLVDCKTFRMSDGAAPNMVLMSDVDGYGTWTDASLYHDDDWEPVKDPEDPHNMNLVLGAPYKKVGLGTSAPMQMLHVCGGNILISKPLGDAPGSLNGSIYFGAEVRPEYPNGEWGIEYINNGLNFWKVNTNSGPSGNYRLFLRNDGNVGIGTDETYGYKLAVAGNVLCAELKVKLVDQWPDYVFDQRNSIPSLTEVDHFINEHKHLPDVPSSEEVRENGINVGEMNAILLKKVEELTLYVIALQKEVDQLKEKVAE